MNNWNDRYNNLSDNSKSALAKLKGTASRLARTNSPFRGCFNKFKTIDRVENWINSVLSELYGFIRSSFSGNVMDTIMTMEQFQANQKGPTGPITESQFYSDVTEKFLSLPSYSYNDEVRNHLERIWNQLQSKLLKWVSFDASSIAFDLSWRELPNVTVRGLPYHDLGKNVDEEIIQRGGRSLYSAINYFKTESDILSFPGYRIQGKPRTKGAKIRLINIPPVSYQYINVGLYKASMSQLKYHPAFSGWLEPVSRQASIQRQLKLAKDRDMTFISLDFSSFDQSCSSYLRKLVNNFIVEADVSRSLRDYKSHFDLLSDNQWLVIPGRNGYELTNANDLLLSGVINTQHDGSLINMLVQAYIAEKLGFEFDPELSLVLGDDVGFCVPNKYLKRMGYKSLLEKMNTEAEKIGFHIHTDKAYPLSQLIFLQKLYVPEQNIIGLGSWARSLYSFCYKERFSKPIKGVYSLPALELISQISIICEAFGSERGVNHSDFANRMVDEWLKVDDLLVACCQELQKTNPDWDGNSLFSLLTKLVGNNYELIASHLGIQSYDHKGTLSSIQAANDYEKVFPILPFVVNRFKQSSFPEKDFSRLLKDLPFQLDSSDEEIVEN